MFYGDRFIFNGVNCEQFGLILYNIGSDKQAPTSFSSNSDFSEDRLPRRYDSLFYGSSCNTPLSFQMTFGVTQWDVDHQKHFDRWDFEKIASWLTGVNGYRWLQIIGEFGIDVVKYKCKISDLQVVEAGIYPYAFSCKVTCDSPFAYLPEETISVQTGSAIVKNRSTYNGIYYPKLEITLDEETELSISNVTTNQTMTFNVPAAYQSSVITVDCQNQIITVSSGDNLYPYCNKVFPGLARGDNTIIVSGNCNVAFICNFPVNVGS